MKKILKFMVALVCMVSLQTANAKTNIVNDGFKTNDKESTSSVQSTDGEPAVKFRFRAEAGVAFAAMGLSTDPNDTKVKKEETINFSSVEPSLALGAEMQLTKNPDLSFMGMFGFGYQSYSKDAQEVKYGQLQLRLGATYIFDSTKKYAPFIYGGLNGNYLVGFDSKGITEDYWIGKSSFDKSGGDMLGMGVFLGGGVNMNLNGHDLRVSLEYAFNAIPPLEIQVHTIGAKVAFVF